MMKDPSEDFSPQKPLGPPQQHAPFTHGHFHPDEAQSAAGDIMLLLAPAAVDPALRRKRRRRGHWSVGIALLVFAAAIITILPLVQSIVERFTPVQDYKGPGGAAVAFEVKAGWGEGQISRALEQQDIIADGKFFLEAVGKVDGPKAVIHPGTYELRQQMPGQGAAEILIEEETPEVSYVAIKENTRLKQVLADTATATSLPLDELTNLAQNPAAFGIKSKAPNLEGYLHPGEYRFPVDAEAKMVLSAMVDATTKKLNEAGVTDPQRQYHVLKVASILQAEARKDDYATVAGALENRLSPDNIQTNGLLQVDSAVIYGLDRYTLQFSPSEKKDAGNRYNTYVHKGLPPTPIGSPGDAALKAAAAPDKNDFYYWVTVNIQTGETKFAKTYAEHLVNQNEFRSWCKENPATCQ